MRIALCQFESPREVAASLEAHLHEVGRAADQGCDLALFPELSLTGYEPSRAQHSAIKPSDPILEPLREISRRRSLTTAIGVPLRTDGGIEIGLVVFHPDGSQSTYAKRLLHTDEQHSFIAGQRWLDLSIAGHRVAPAICYEALQPSHGSASIERGATLYAASVAKHARGMEEAHRYLQSFARTNSIPVVLVNAVGQSEGFESAGRSAAWRGDGSLAGELGNDPGLLVVEL